MKIFKIILLTVLSTLLVVYLAFLFVLPNLVDLNQYSPQITTEIEKSSGFKVKTKGVKISTNWNLSAGALIDKTDLAYPTGEKFAQINNLNVKLSLLPLFWGQVKLNSVAADKIIVNLKVEKSGKFLIEKYLPKSDKKTVSNQNKSVFGLKISPSMPAISAKKYRITFIDTKNSKEYSLKGTDFKISDFILDKKIKIKAVGNLILNNRKQIAYNLSIFSKVLPELEQKQSNKFQNINILTIFEDLYKYNLSANIKTDLKITGTPDESKIDGNLGLDNLYLTINGKTLPPSAVKLIFDKDKIKIKSDFYTDTNEKAVITGIFKNGKNKSINLNVLSDKTDIANTVLMAKTVSQLFGTNDFKGLNANGVLRANFNLKSDFKTIQSEGFLKIENADMTNDLYNLSLNSIFADIDFSQNKIKIKKSQAKLNGEPIILSGTIDNNANADLLIFAENLPLKGALATLGKREILKDNDILGGLVSIKASLKGRLDKAYPSLNIILNNVNLNNKSNNVKIKLTKAQINMVPKGKKNKGNIELVGLIILPHSSLKMISAPKANLGFDEKDLTLNKTALYLNNSKIIILGKITDYGTKKQNMDFSAQGLMLAKDVKSMLPLKNQSGVFAVGKIPLTFKITGDENKQKIYAQMLANQTNNLAVFDINSLKGKTSLINVRLDRVGDDININEITLYLLKQSKGLSQNMDSNLSSGVKIASARGKISEINSSNPVLKGISLTIPNQITTSIPGYLGSSASIKGDLTVNGTMNNPDTRGYLTVAQAYLPTIKTSLKNLVVHFNKNSISANCPQAEFINSLLSFNAVISNDFSKGIIIQNLDFTTNLIDLDLLGKVFQNQSDPKIELVISNGKGKFDKVKVGGIVATNVTSDLNMKNNILKFDNLRGGAYFGKVAGSINYNLLNRLVELNLQGRGLSAAPAIKGLINGSTNITNNLTGQLDFDTNVSMKVGLKTNLLKSLKGNTNFILYNGKMGTLCKLEHLLYAQNILSNNVFKATLNVIIKAITVKNTGTYKYIKGKVNFTDGWANIGYIKTSGPSMSMYITGRYNLLDNFASLVILGRLSDDVVRLMGPIGDLSVDKVFSYIPKVGEITSFLINQMTTNPTFENVSMIPFLSPKTELPTKEFKVILNGNISSQSSVKYFKWLSKPRSANTAPVTQPTRYILEDKEQQIAPADFINSLPDLKR